MCEGKRQRALECLKALLTARRFELRRPLPVQGGREGGRVGRKGEGREEGEREGGEKEEKEHASARER